MPTPVRLEDLEVFMFQSLQFHTQQTVLRLTLPGTKPLKMSTAYCEMDLRSLPAPNEEEFCRFFRRANIVQLHVHSHLLLVKLPKLLEFLPSLEILTLRRVDITLGNLGISKRDGLAVLAPLCPQLRGLHLVSSRFSLDAFRWITGICNLQEVTIWNTLFYDGTKHISVQDSGDSSIADIFPSIRVLDPDCPSHENMFASEGWGEDMEDRMAVAAMDNYTA
ncbi:hypothetical protein FRC11_013445, partial [Ceratobasidium sp. 423]